MKYFEFTEPYWAVVAAKSEDRAIEIYDEVVSDIDDDLEMEEIDKKKVIEMWEKISEPLYELVDIIHEEGLLMVDGSL